VFNRVFHDINYQCHITNFAYVARYLLGERRGRFIICEKSVITMKLLWHNYLVRSLGNCATKLCTETGLRITTKLSFHFYNFSAIYMYFASSCVLDLGWRFYFSDRSLGSVLTSQHCPRFYREVHGTFIQALKHSRDLAMSPSGHGWRRARHISAS
jgi:hypothetical protein